MTVKNTKLGGSDFSTPDDRVKPTDLNDTFDACADRGAGAGKAIAQLSYEQVKSDATEWTNTDYLGADIFTDSDGAKNTVDTSSSTADWDTTNPTYYYLFNIDTYDLFDDASLDTNLWTEDSSSLGTVTEAGGTLTVNADIDQNRYNSWTEYANVTADSSFDNFEIDVDSVTVSASAASGGKLITSLARIMVGSEVIVDKEATANGGSVALSATYDDLAAGIWKLQKTGADEWTLYKGGVSQRTFSGLTGALKIEGIITDDGDVNNSNVNCTAEIVTNYVKQITTNFTGITSKTVETDTIIDEVVADTIVVYGKTDIPANTGITVDVSDDGGGTFPLTGQSLNEAIDTSSFSTGDLALRFNLSTSDSSATPKLYGYGVTILDS